jgi:hypothetical protein
MELRISKGGDEALINSAVVAELEREAAELESSTITASHPRPSTMDTAAQGSSTAGEGGLGALL